MPADSPSPRGDAVYLDHAAATPLRSEVAAAMQEAAESGFANPSSPHAAGRRARVALEDARERILAAIGGTTTGPHRDRLVLTSGATEANRLGVIGPAAGLAGCVAWSARDHSSVAAAARDLAGRGWQATVLELSDRGSVAAAAGRFVETLPAAGSAVLCMTPVCGQTGIRDRLEPLAGWMMSHPRLLVHADVTQAVAWDEIAFRDLAATTIAFAPHKFGGPRGIGGLVVRAGVRIDPLLPGPQELGLRGGTESVGLAVGFARAVELAVVERAETARRLTGLRDLFEGRLAAAATAAGLDLCVVGEASDRGPHISTVAISGCERQMVAMAADLAGVCLATGTACASGSSEPSPTIAALGMPAWVAHAAVRISFGRSSTEADVLAASDRLIDVFRGIATGGLQPTPPHR
ncbi:MAG: aminotransferase class V-fold PLP-dependent enzyme [Planctomycetia bacterium]|nr:aminotransferase class V-fold PLP-dependent enzyme [Planctomycetia bacterium]